MSFVDTWGNNDCVTGLRRFDQGLYRVHRAALLLAGRAQCSDVHHENSQNDS
jgi:hypothetical protein